MVSANQPTILSGSSYSFLPINSRVGNDAVKLGPISFDLTENSWYQIDLSQPLSLAKLKNGICAMYADGSQCPASAQVTVQQTQQTITVPAGSCGYFPLLDVMTDCTLNVIARCPTLNNSLWLGQTESTAQQIYYLSSALQLSLLNVPCVAATWPAGSWRRAQNSIYLWSSGGPGDAAQLVACFKPDYAPPPIPAFPFLLKSITLLPEAVSFSSLPGWITVSLSGITIVDRAENIDWQEYIGEWDVFANGYRPEALSVRGLNLPVASSSALILNTSGDFSADFEVFVSVEVEMQ